MTALQSTRWLITGASGQLGGHVVAQLCERDVESYALAGRASAAIAGAQLVNVNLREADALRAAVHDIRPACILHIGAMTAVSDAHANPGEAERVNVAATQALVDAANDANARIVFTSTDMVFDGAAAPYDEAAATRPLSVYGKTKAAAERTMAAASNGLVVRLPLMYGFPLSDRSTTFVQQVTALRNGASLRLFTDEFRTPVSLADSARALIGLTESELTGTIHVAGPQRLSRYELVAECAKVLRLPPGNLIPISRLDIPAAEPRPADLSLAGGRLAGFFPHLAPRAVAEQALALPPAR